MGEHSIIIPESRDIDRESGLRVVRGSASAAGGLGGRESSGGGVGRRGTEIDGRLSSASRSPREARRRVTTDSGDRRGTEIDGRLSSASRSPREARRRVTTDSGDRRGTEIDGRLSSASRSPREARRRVTTDSGDRCGTEIDGRLSSASRSSREARRRVTTDSGDRRGTEIDGRLSSTSRSPREARRRVPIDSGDRRGTEIDGRLSSASRSPREARRRVTIDSGDRRGTEIDGRLSSASRSPREARRRVTINSGDRGLVERAEGAAGRAKARCRRRNRRRGRTSRSGGIAAASRGLFERVSLLVLTLLGIPIPFGSSRGPPLVSSSCALVSLLVVGLLRPSMAVPAAGSVAGNNPAGENHTEPPLARLAGRNEPAVEERADSVSVVEATMNRGVRVLEEEPAATELRVAHDRNGDQDYATPLQQRESGLERRSRLGEAELDTIRRSIVEGLGLERIPDPSKANVSQTEYRRAHEEYLTRLQHSRAGKDGRQRRLHTFHAAEQLPVTLVNRTRRSAANFTADGELKHRRESYRRSRTLYFPIEIPDDDVRVDHATLRFLLDPSTVDEVIRDIYVYRLTAHSPSLVTRQSLLPGERAPRWVELDVTDLASLWHEGNDDDNFGLKLSFDNGNGRGDVEQPIVAHPAMNVFTTTYTYGENDARLSRRKRRAGPEHLMSLHKGRRTECRGDNKKCCRHEMTVIFKDLKGFEFIVQPKNFDAGYCKGRCPPRYNPAHHHALLQSLIWKEDKRKAPRPCCAPSKLDELEILYFDENDPTKLKVSSWKNMKVLECACS